MRHFAPALLLAALATPAWAADDATAQSIATDINTTITSALSQYSTDFSFAAPVQVSVEGEGYLVSYGALTATLPDGRKLEVPPYTAHLNPMGNDLYGVEVAIPSPLKLIGADGQPAWEATIGGQKITSTWQKGAPAYAAFPTADVRLENILIKDATGQELGKIASFASQSHITTTPDNKVTQDITARLQGASGHSADDKVKFVLEQGTLESHMTGADAAAYEALQQKAADIRKASADSKMTAASNPADIFSKLTDLFGQAGKVGGSNKGEVKLTNLGIAFLSGEKPTLIKLPTVTFGGEGATDATTGLGWFKLAYRHDGLEVSPPPSDEVADYLPKAMLLNMGVENLPMAKLFEGLGEVMSTATLVPEQPNAGVPEFRGKILGLLDEANTTFRINELKFGSRALAGSLTGSLEANQQAILGGAGSFDGIVKGLDEQVKAKQDAMTASLQSEDPAIKQRAIAGQGALMGLSMLQAMGQKDTSATGLSTRTYKIELTPDGQLKVNGTPFGNLGAMAQPAHGAPEAPAGTPPATPAPPAQ